MRVRLVFSVLAASASAFVSLPMTAHAEGLEGTYRGTFVCQKMKQSPDMLRAPFDMTISGKTAVFARPVFNRNGTRVVGSELATGTVEDNGTVQVKSEWSAAGFGYQGSYSGAIKDKVGTLTGTQGVENARRNRDAQLYRGFRATFVTLPRTWRNRLGDVFSLASVRDSWGRDRS